jgi:hypothetical protein
MLHQRLCQAMDAGLGTLPLFDVRHDLDV